MTQGALPFKYEEEKKGFGLTALGGLPVYLDMARLRIWPECGMVVDDAFGTQS
jgi:hypothetical protein